MIKTSDLCDVSGELKAAQSMLGRLVRLAETSPTRNGLSYHGCVKLAGQSLRGSYRAEESPGSTEHDAG
jgi:hypothetical protein